MLFPRSPVTVSPVARLLMSGYVAAIRELPRFRTAPIQDTIDSAFSATCYAIAYAAGERAARALQVGDVFLGSNPASVEHFGSDPAASPMPVRARLEHKAFRAGYVEGLPALLRTDRETGEIVSMRRAVARTRPGETGFIVVRSEAPGSWYPVNAAMVFATPGEALDAARNPPVMRERAA